MSDLISREAAIGKLVNLHEYDEGVWDINVPAIKLEDIEELPAVGTEPKWISVEERLPPCGERVLITEGSAVFEAYLSISNKWVRNGIGWMECVTHWMPLPEPPKEG